MPQLTSPGDTSNPACPITPPRTRLTEPALPSSPSAGGAVGYNQNRDLSFPVPQMSANGAVNLPSSSQTIGTEEKLVSLELEDGTVYQGYSFGADKSVAGELVFQTGMVGYPESITDPSYRGQILVITFPLAGNYGVPSRDDVDELLNNMPKYFESNEIHIAGLVVATYCGEDFSHFLAESSLGTWLKENDVAAMHGVDTRALTKRIREEGSMLGRVLLQKPGTTISCSNGNEWRSAFEEIEWIDPNKKNLVADGEALIYTFLGSGGMHIYGSF